MTPSVRIRRIDPLAERDVQGLCDVLMDCVEGGASVSFMLPITRAKAETFWRDAAASAARGERVVLVADDDSSVVGTVQVVWAEPENQPHRGELAKMLVHRRARRRGIGAALLEAAEQAARDAGKTLLVLDTADAAAERLYARRGWRRVGEIPRYALMPDGAVCATTVFFKALGQDNGRATEVDMQIVACTYEAHAGAMLAILNDVIATSTALFDYKPRSAESMIEWFRAKRVHGYPVIGAVGEEGTLLGFATYGAFRPWPAYKYTIEHSVYVHAHHRGRGVGRALVRRLIELAEEQQYHAMVAGIDSSNATSIALHEKLGFVRAGTIQEAGFKFGRWLDLVFYQRLLRTPREPQDG